MQAFLLLFNCYLCQSLLFSSRNLLLMLCYCFFLLSSSLLLLLKFTFSLCNVLLFCHYSYALFLLSYCRAQYIIVISKKQNNNNKTLLLFDYVINFYLLLTHMLPSPYAMLLFNCYLCQSPLLLLIWSNSRTMFLLFLLWLSLLLLLMFHTSCTIFLLMPTFAVCFCQYLLLLINHILLMQCFIFYCIVCLSLFCNDYCLFQIYILCHYHIF